MSTGHRDDADERYYHSSGRNSTRQQRDLPSIRDMFGDVLDQPVLPRRMPSSYEVGTSSREAYPSTSQETRNDTISFRDHQQSRSIEQPPSPPVRSRSAYTGSSRTIPSSTLPYERSNTYPPQGTLRGYASSRVPQPTPSSSHSFDVFVASDQGLVHQRSSRQDNFRQMSKEEAISQSRGKHVCPNCGRRFEKPSHLRNHLTSHSGEKPYECPWPGCGRTFSAASNMRRHQRSHRQDDLGGQRDG